MSDSQKELLTTSEAIALAAKYGITVTGPGLRGWINKFGFGHQVGGFGGRWYVNREKFVRFLHGKSTHKINETEYGCGADQEDFAQEGEIT